MDTLYDRAEAGRELARLLKSYEKETPIILGMPRGGVVVAYEIASLLHAPLDVIVTRKIGAPNQPEFAIGAIAPGDIVLLNKEVIKDIQLSNTEIQSLINNETQEMKRRLKLYRGNRPAIDVKNKTIIVVDDGLATGLTALAAIRSLRQLHPKKIILAMGACARDSTKRLQQEVDELICLLTPEPFYAVGQWYRYFDQTTDEEVIQLLTLNRNALSEIAMIQERAE